MYALYYAGLREARAKIVEALDEAGGGLKVLYPEKYIYDVAGFPRIMAKDMVALFYEQARTYGAPILFGQRVVDLRRRDDGIFELETADTVHFSKAVIICAGMGAYIPRKIEVPNLSRLEGAGVFYYIREAAWFKDKTVMIVGGGDSAVDNALMLEPLARKVILLHRNDRFRAHESSVEKLRESSVELHYPFWEIKEIFGEEWVEAVLAVNTFDGREKRYKIDALILNLGFLTNLKPMKEWGLELQYNAVKVDPQMQTNIPGVFAAGDIVYHPGKLKLISTGTGEAATAVNHAIHHICPHKPIEPGHSSHLSRPEGRE